MEIKASLNHLHISPRKVRAVAGLLRGLPLEDARVQLRIMSRRSSEALLKLLNSAAANVKNNFGLDEKRFFVKEIRVDGGEVAKRYRPRAFGRASLIRKRTSRVSLILDNAQIPAKSKSLKKEGPEVRDFTASDLKVKSETSRARFRKESSGKTSSPKIKTPRFAKKIFRRKAI